MIFHPDLDPVAKWLPRFWIPARLVALKYRLTRVCGPLKPPVVEGVAIEDIAVPSCEGGAPVRIRLYRPEAGQGPVAAMLWMHGGGLVAGVPEIDEDKNIAIVRELGIAVAAVAYRLAPRHPFPSAIEDCYAALKWLHQKAEAFGVRADRLCVGGASAGGGLAAGLAMLAHDRGEVPVAFQLLVYPMIDDRTVLRTDMDTSHVRLWSAADNRYAWGAYLKGGAGRDDVNPYAAPARRKDLSGLPPTWLGVGTLDLFYDEGVDFASRLNRAGVPCDLHVVPGAFHGFDRLSPKANVARQFRQSYLEALRRALS